MDPIDRQAAIDTEGLDEQIRCEMCRNPMHTDRGCDGNCKYDEKLYERIMQILGERIKPLPSAQQEEAIPIAWLEEQAKWFESIDNAFAKIEANNIRVMIKKWRSEKDERSD